MTEPIELIATPDSMIADALSVETRQMQDWYTGPGQEFLSATDDGRLAFMWDAKYKDGNHVRQYDEITFLRALVDKSFIPSIDRIISIRSVDQDKLAEFCLYPTAYTISKCPRIGRSFRMVIRPERGEKLICNWCVDVNQTTGRTIRRHVIGIEKEGHQLLFVISPSGTMTLATDDNVSFEGE